MATSLCVLQRPLKHHIVVVFITRDIRSIIQWQKLATKLVVEFSSRNQQQKLVAEVSSRSQQQWCGTVGIINSAKFNSFLHRHEKTLVTAYHRKVFFASCDNLSLHSLKEDLLIYTTFDPDSSYWIMPLKVLSHENQIGCMCYGRI